MVTNVMTPAEMNIALPDNPYHFQVLPVHPQPQPFESLTSYLTRLAESNRISTVYGLSMLLFPGQDARITRGLADYPPVRLDSLSRISCCSNANLLATTFYHLSRKFGGSGHPQAISRFMGTAIANVLRYCPLCVDEKKTYSLLWRFNQVIGCIEHDCLLLSQCGNCGSVIPFLSAPLRIGMCPKCHFPLEKCQPTPLNRTDRKVTESWANQLRFLLTPCSFEENISQTMEVIGDRFITMRKERGLSRDELATKLDITVSTLEVIERGNPNDRVSSFIGFIRYAEYMGFTLPELFNDVLSSPYRKKDKPVVPSEGTLIQNVNEAIQSLLDNEQRISVKSIARTIHTTSTVIHKYPSVISLIQEARALDEKIMGIKIGLIAEDLAKTGKPIKLRTVAKALGMSPPHLCMNPNLLAIFHAEKDRLNFSHP